MPNKYLISASTVLEANGSGWSCNYEACLYRVPQNHYPMSFPYHHGFLLCVRIFHILTALYLDDLSFIDPDSDSDSDPDSIKFHIHLPSSISSSYNPTLNNDVDTVLAHFGVPTSDRESLVRRLFDMMQSDHEKISTRECVPLVLDFYKTVVLRNEAEAADWLCGGRMDSVIVNTLRATHNTVSKLGMTSFDGSSSKMESCMVCLEGFEDGESVNRLPCSHEFHHNCIAKWLGCNHRCPVCRFPMDWVHIYFIN